MKSVKPLGPWSGQVSNRGDFSITGVNEITPGASEG